MTKARIIRLYTEDERLSIREVADRIGVTRSAAEYVLKGSGVTIRRQVRGKKPLSELALEIHDDMRSQFGGHCSRADLVDWLGESSAAIAKALGELRRHGWVTCWGLTYTAVEGRPA